MKMEASLSVQEKQEQNPVFRELISKLQLELSQRLKQQVDLMENSFVWI